MGAIFLPINSIIDDSILKNIFLLFIYIDSLPGQSGDRIFGGSPFNGKS